MDYTKNLITELLECKVFNINRLNKIKRKFANDRKISMAKNEELLKTYRQLVKNNEIKANPELEKVLKRRSIRTLSGVAPITLMTAPMGCPKNCLYCPSELNMPKSYLSNQPAAMRAVMSDFDPIKQTQTRLRALKKNGHDTDKIEIIIIGGTWSAHPKTYQVWFINNIFEVCNNFDEQSIETHAYSDFSKAKQTIKDKLQTKIKINPEVIEADDDKLIDQLFTAQKINQTAKNRIIGITIETRPEYITPDEVKRLRLLGVTKVELGVQTIYPEIIKLNRREQQLEEVIQATKLLKDAGFKVGYHIMPGMYGSTPAKDIAMFKELFSNQTYKPDFLKIYPCVVVKDSDLYQIFKQGKFKPYSCEILIDTIVKLKQYIPRYCRIARLHRDIPMDSIKGGCDISNIRQYIAKELKKQNLTCQCIRCREPKQATASSDRAIFHTEKIQASQAEEYFLTLNSADDRYLYAFLRLRLPNQTNQDIISKLPELKDVALIRELHTYGVLTPLSDKNKTKAVQHLGFGRYLMKQAEDLAQKHGFKKMAVIAGIGVREYYKILGYRLEGTYMVKTLA